MWCQSVISRVAKYEEPARLQRPSSFSVNGKTQSTGKECLCVCLRAFVRKDRREKVVAQLSDGREREREREKGWIRGHGRLIALQFKSWFLGKRYCTGRPREKQRASKENPPKKTKQKFFGLCVRERGTVASREWKSRSWNWPNAIFCVSSLFLSLSLSFVKKLWTSQGLCEGKLGPAPFSRASTSF